MSRIPTGTAKRLLTKDAQPSQELQQAHHVPQKELVRAGCSTCSMTQKKCYYEQKAAMLIAERLSYNYMK